LALTVGTLGVGIMNSMAFLLLSNSNSKIDGNRITFGAVDFQSHPPTLVPVFANLDQEMDLMIGSFNSRVGSLGSARLSDPIKSGASIGKTTSAANAETLVGSSSEVNLSVGFKPMKNKKSTIEELNEIMENLDLGKPSGMVPTEKLTTSRKRTSPPEAAVSPTTMRTCGG
jgi:hypothetical protein